MLLAVYALFDLLFVILSRKGVPEEAEDLSHLPETATDVLLDCHRQRPLPRRFAKLLSIFYVARAKR